jgi:ABC-type enterobactin transport system permease subunit
MPHVGRDLKTRENVSLINSNLEGYILLLAQLALGLEHRQQKLLPRRLPRSLLLE